MPIDYSKYTYTAPAERIRALNVDPPETRIFDGLRKYEAAARGFNILSLEQGADAAFVLHRPADSPIPQVFRLRLSAPLDDEPLERLTYFAAGAGRSITNWHPVAGDNWRGRWRPGGAIFCMDGDGNEMFQVWRYWEDPVGTGEPPLPRSAAELDNAPGRGRVERLTHDEARYGSLVVAESGESMVFTSTAHNGRDTLTYLAPLTDSYSFLPLPRNLNADGEGFDLAAIARNVTPLPEPDAKGTTRLPPEAISADGRWLLLLETKSTGERPAFLVDLTLPLPQSPKPIKMPGATEPESETTIAPAAFSLDAGNQTLYTVTSAYGDFISLVALDLSLLSNPASEGSTGTVPSVTHITTAGPFDALAPINWDVPSSRVAPGAIVFRANVGGWYVPYVMPLRGQYANKVIKVNLDWEGGVIVLEPHLSRPCTLLAKLTSYKCSGRLALLDLDFLATASSELDSVRISEDSELSIDLVPRDFKYATPEEPDVRSIKPELRTFKSFDGLEVPFIYYHPDTSEHGAVQSKKQKRPVIIGIHGGPASQATVQYRSATPAIHGYLLNELGCAVIYPNVRGSVGYGKRYMAADDVEKREDSVRDIGALIDYIASDLSDELDASRIAVMGGSYGGYMVYAVLVHFSSKLTCGLANYGIGHWPSFLRRTAAHRRSHRRKEYGDESTPDGLDLLESISPLNRAEEINVPLSIAHGETDSRVTIDEAVEMWERVHERVHCELLVCEKEGHGT
ncbi:alpha/beta-hydrolase [Peniophora sp. CONT]|nr:alpha/beta-hydrolase [Peniophora sp. CONT]